jgi:hypothetical protein
MTTAQESPDGRHSFPPPCSFPDSQDQNRSKDSTNNNSNSIATNDQVVERQKAFAANVYQQDELRGVKEVITPLLAQEKVPASAYHVPPELYAPKADSFRDTIPDGLSNMKLPDRCQFMFSDGRQCTMARSDIHPSLCTYHSDREEQLFGDPTYRRETRALDFPELFSASRDLATAAGVTRALGQVFRLFAQRRISRQEAATFAKLAHLLLQSIRAAHAEADSARAEFNAIHDEHPGDYASNGVILSKQRERRISPNPIPANEIPPFSQHQNSGASISQPVPLTMNPPSERITPAASREPLSPRTADSNSAVMNTSAPFGRNSPEINTSENAELKPEQNQHLQEVRREHHGIVP